MKISVIVPTYNEAETIEDCLASLEKQSYKDFEIIVVDDGSSDQTLSILSKLEISPAEQSPALQENLKLIILHQLHKGPGAARNLGTKHSSGEILVFVDADMTFDKNFLKNLVKPIMAGKTKGTFSRHEYVSNWDNPWAKCWNINQNWEDKRRHPKNYPDKQKVFRAIVKSEFDKVAGFVSGDYTDDYSLFEKLGYMADSAPNAIFYHRNPDNLTEIFKQARWIGKRKYKLRKFGYFVAAVRAFFPISILIGIIKSIMNTEPRFLIFKIVYDFGIFVGILGLLTGEKPTK